MYENLYEFEKHNPFYIQVYPLEGYSPKKSETKVMW